MNRSLRKPKTRASGYLILLFALVLIFSVIFAQPSYAGPIGDLIDGAINALVSLIAGWILSGVDWILDMFLGALGADLSKLVQTLPGLEALSNIILAIGIGLGILIAVWQVFRSFTNVINEENLESPVRTLVRLLMFVPLTFFSKQIATFALSIIQVPYNWLLNPEQSGIDNQYSNQGLSTLASTMKNSMNDNFDFAGMLTVGTILGTVLAVMIAWNVLKLLLEATERYVVCGALVYLSPLAFATGTSKVTSHILASWASMFAGQAVLLLLNVWCIKVALTALMGLAAANDLILWMLVVLAFLKVSQNMDEIMSTLGISVSRTGRNMLDDIMATGASISRMGRALGGGGKLDGNGAPVGSNNATSGGSVSFTKPNNLPSPARSETPTVGQGMSNAIKNTKLGQVGSKVAESKPVQAVKSGAQSIGNRVGFDKSPAGLAARGVGAIGNAIGSGINAVAGRPAADRAEALSYAAESKENAATAIQDYLNGGANPGGLDSTMPGSYNAADSATNEAVESLNSAFSEIAGSDSRFNGSVPDNPDLTSVKGMEFAKNEDGQNVIRAISDNGHGIEVTGSPTKDGHSVQVVSTARVPGDKPGTFKQISKNTGAYIKVINKPPK